MKNIKILINNQTFIVQDTEKGEIMTLCMDVYKEQFNLIEVLTS